jgi:acetyl-CoA C-acetyltransferase
MNTKNIAIIGTAITKFGELWEKDLSDLFSDVVERSIRDAGIEPSDVDAVFVANKAAGNFENQSHLNALVSQCFEHFPPAMRIEAACASGGAAVLAAEYALHAGQYETVLVVGVEKMTDVSAEETTAILSSAADAVHQYGSTFPGLYALLADAYLRQFKLQPDALAAVAVKNHRHALSNSLAQFRKELTIDAVLRSAVVAPPLHVLDCSPISDGAAAVVLTTKKHTHKAKILGFGHGQDVVVLAQRDSLTTFAATRRAAEQAYEFSGLSPKEIQVAEVHDCFTIAEILAVADLGLVDQKDAGIAALEGLTTYGGQVVINPSGGLKACGHPVGATGVKQVAYLADLLAQGEMQYALAHNVGGAGATAVVHILGGKDA